MLAYTLTKLEGAILLECSDNRRIPIDNWNDMITELLVPCDMGLCWNIDNFVATFASLFDKETQDKILDGGRVILKNGERLFYQPQRMFAITYLSTEINFFGLSRYADKEPENIQGLSQLGLDVIEAYKYGFNITPTRLSSPISVYSDVLLKVPFPRSCNLPSSSIPMINKAGDMMLREWREVHKLGYWNENEVSDMDLTSAYPSIIANLPDISKAKFFESDTMPDKYSWGILSGDLEVIRDVSPFQDENGIHRKGLIKDQLITTDGLWILKTYGGNFAVKHGWFLSLPKPFTYPFLETMKHLYLMRETEWKLVASIAKQISVGVYGMLAQRYERKEGWKLGDHFNSIYALITTSKCSLYVAKFIYDNNLDSRVINITVDGFLCEGLLNVPKEKEFGKWRLNAPSSALVISQLNAWHEDKHPNGKYLNEMIEAIKDKPKSSTYFDIDLNLMEYNRLFPKRPRNGNELMKNKFHSLPYEIKEK